MTAQDLQLRREAISKITRDLMGFPAFVRGSLLEDASTLAGDDVDLQAHILGVAYGLLLANSMVSDNVDDIENDTTGAAIVIGSFPTYKDVVHTLAEMHRKSKATIDNITEAMAMLKKEE